MIKTTSRENKERILNAIRLKKQITYKGKPIKIMADFSMEKQEGNGVKYSFRALNENKLNPRIL
jgi:hypothetical protein